MLLRTSPEDWDVIHTSKLHDVAIILSLYELYFNILYFMAFGWGATHAL